MELTQLGSFVRLPQVQQQNVAAQGEPRNEASTGVDPAGVKPGRVPRLPPAQQQKVAAQGGARN